LPAAAFSGKKLITDEDIDGWVVSSESCNFISMGARYYREVLKSVV
jgi:glutamine phosphoribosylpyrophosphate amidotransferase